MKRRRQRNRSFETLEPRTVLAGDLEISEFMTANQTTLLDGFGATSDWIELHNASEAALDLSGYYLTDNENNLHKWQLPAGTQLASDAYLTIFASGFDTTDPQGHLHTSFQLASNKGYLALIAPDGRVLSEYGTSGEDYPPQFGDHSYGIGLDQTTGGDLIGYFSEPTPSAPNVSTVHDVGPWLRDVTDNPGKLAANAPLIITADVSQRYADIANVALVYRVMYGEEITLPMRDDGLQGDSVAGDGKYAATIPAGVALPGQMVRWYVTASDTSARTSRAPAFLDKTGEDQSPEYFGSLVADANGANSLPVLEWFMQPGTESRANTVSGTRASVFYANEFYDNIFVRLRGNTSASLPKKSYKLDFNTAYDFRFAADNARVQEINLNTTYTNKDYMRQVLAFDAYDAAGLPASEAFAVRVNRSGEFYSVSVLVEQPDEDMLSREGLDPNGALYKMYNAFTSGSSSVEKKTRQYEGNADLIEFVTQINSLAGEQLRNYVFDNVNIPSVLNYLATTAIIQNNDQMAKNYYLYRDSNGTGEWSILPWDLDLTFGLHFMSNDSILDDVIWADKDNFTTFAGVTIWPSHPFVGDQEHPANRNWNRLIDALYEVPEFREMYLRRLRTLMDELLQAPGTAMENRYFETQIDNYAQQMAADVQLDYDKWANPWQWGNDESFAETLQRVKDEYLSVRRRHLYQTHGVDNLEPAPYNVLIPEFTAASYFVPGDDVLGTSWTNPTFDDSQWTIGDTGLGFEDTPRNFTDLLHTRVKPAEMAAGSTSIYARIPFTVEDVSQLENLTLRMKYDDGFVAYLNGVEVARSGTCTSGEQTFESRATSRSNTLAVEFENFVLSEHLDKLQNGKNVLAIHVINASPTNNDLLLVPELIDGIILNTDVAGIPHEQTNDISIEIGSTLDYAPASGNEDEEYFVLVNPNPFAVDVSGWSIAGSVATTLDPGTVIGSGQSLYLTPDPSAFRARATSPTGAEGHLVQALTGHLPNQGGALQLLDATGRIVNTLQYVGGGQSPQRALRITEINYNPHDAMPAFGELDTASDNFEFIEITNTGDADVDLTGMKLVEIDVAADTQGVAYAFAGGSLAAGERIVVVKNATAFASRYGSTVPVAGEFTGRLSNGGETLTLLDTASDVIHQFSYDDSVAWPTLADGRGGTLEVINAQGDYNDPLNWQSSFQLGGSPGAASPSISTDVVINELLTNTALPEVDQIELFNAGEAPIDVGGWYLTDGNNLTKFRITGANTILAPGQYLVFNETELGFGFNGSSDDDARLIRPDANGRPVSYADVVDFGPTLPGVSIGRVPDGTGAWQILSATSFGRPNTGGALPGDLDGNGVVDANDIDLLCRAIRFDQQLAGGDLNNDDTLDEADFTLLIGNVLATTPGDANLDGIFNSSDLVLVFQAGQYEDEVADNSGWATGDWNCDGEFSSADLVSAFQSGGFVAAAQPKAITADAIDAVFTHATWRRMRRETLGRRSE